MRSYCDQLDLKGVRLTTFRAMVAQTLLALLEEPLDGSPEGGSNSLRWWTRTQRIRTAAELPFEAVLTDAVAVPLCQRIASKALHLHHLGLRPSAIARRLEVASQTVAKALALLAKPRQAE